MYIICMADWDCKHNATTSNATPLRIAIVQTCRSYSCCKLPNYKQRTQQLQWLSLIDWNSDTLSRGYSNLQSLVKCLDHRGVASNTVCSQAAMTLSSQLSLLWHQHRVRSFKFCSYTIKWCEEPCVQSLVSASASMMHVCMRLRKGIIASMYKQTCHAIGQSLWLR